MFTTLKEYISRELGDISKDLCAYLCKTYGEQVIKLRLYAVPDEVRSDMISYAAKLYHIE